MLARTSPSIRNFHKGKIIFSEGQESKVAYMIKSGTVNIYRKINRQKTVLATLRRGDIFGEMALLANQKRTAFAEASSFCELVVLTEDLMQKLLAAAPCTVQKMVELLAKRVVETDGKSSDSDQSDSFIALATILNVAYKEFAYLPRDKQAGVKNYKMGLSVSSFKETVKSLAMFSNLEIESFLDTVFKLRLIEMKSLKKGDKGAFVEKYITIKDIEQFMHSLRNLYKQMQELGASVESRMSYMTFSDLAARTGTKPELVYKKILKEEMPDNLLFFNREKALEWRKDKDENFFKKFKRPRKVLEDLENVDDLIYIDNPALLKVFAEFEFYKISVLYSAGDSRIKNKIKRNIGRKMANILEQEPPDARDHDDPEVLECCDELFDLVRKLKRAI
ncbi:cyclic nucleotide-binding domain-containing protein [Maridesulfovibrio hydrothermalis]|uniref:Putative transcriptional regulator, Crp/Fnr family n=1 Tax=Maridesulfovibrio hydrothermalis AM13 = DSM 14728 TaxID=1121451 RepID=L0RCK0_9BACT|nr:cyclic nucleotide-binding domain-containing protein [Maridesulfovibrio hydrothermalis]CCO24474.1 putative transcriptional regulator, Crp/Fnr family [Maridesulfovibrio hydrothermalis AM13 = DSM 14728]